MFGVTCDVSANEQVMELKSQLQRQWAAPVDVLVNNAGIFHNTPAEEMPVDEWDRTLKVDLSSVFTARELSVRTCWPAEQARS